MQLHGPYRLPALGLAVVMFALACVAAIAASAQTVLVSGRITGHAGAVVTPCHVQAYSAYGRAPLALARADSAGHFMLPIPHAGLIRLCFVGAGHARLDTQLLITGPDPVELNAYLSAQALPEHLNGVRAIVALNETGPPLDTPLVRLRNGTFALKLRTTSATARYVLSVNGSNTAGTPFSAVVDGSDAKGLRYNPGRCGYENVVHARRGFVIVTFNPRTVPSVGNPAIVVVNTPQAAALAGLHGASARLDRLMAASRGQQGNATAGADSAALQQRDRLRELIDTATQPWLRRAALAYYANLLGQGLRFQDLDPGIAAQALAEIEPASPYWLAARNALPYALMITQGAEGHAYDAVTAQPDTAYAAALCYSRLVSAHYRQDSLWERRYYACLTTRFAASAEAALAIAHFAPDRPVRIGHRVPHFSIAELVGAAPSTGAVISDSLMQGRYYLLQFWATWCAPCVAEIPEIEQAHALYPELAIISVSFDRSPDDVVQFRARRHPMPWAHAWASPGARADLAQRFDAEEIPQMLLVDRDGIVRATGAELGPGMLGSTLRQLLGTNQSPIRH